MPSGDPLSDPGIRALLGATLVKVMLIAWYALSFLDKLSRVIWANVDRWKTRDQRWGRKTAAEPTPRVVPLRGTGATGSLAAGHAVVSGTAGIRPGPVVLAAAGQVRFGGTAG